MKRLRQWLWPRHADVPPLRLGQRRIYVLPTKAGMMYAVTLLFMLVGSINYNLSLGYALTFLLAGLGVLAIVQSFRNLSGLQLAPTRHAPGFAGERIHFGVDLASERPRASLQLQCAGGPPLFSHVDTHNSVSLAVPALQRGWQAMPRLSIASTWPLGLIRAWSYARFEERCLVYPAPAPDAPAHHGHDGEGLHMKPDEPDDFFGLRPHRPTDQPQQVAWKASARLDEQLLSKQFATEQGDALHFDLAHTPGTTLEEKLSVLTRWVLDAHAARQTYSLRLGGQSIAPAAGSEHLHACLQALALYS